MAVAPPMILHWEVPITGLRRPAAGLSEVKSIGRLFLPVMMAQVRHILKDGMDWEASAITIRKVELVFLVPDLSDRSI